MYDIYQQAVESTPLPPSDRKAPLGKKFVRRTVMNGKYIYGYVMGHGSEREGVTYCAALGFLVFGVFSFAQRALNAFLPTGSFRDHRGAGGRP